MVEAIFRSSRARNRHHAARLQKYADLTRRIQMIPFGQGATEVGRKLRGG